MQKHGYALTDVTCFDLFPDTNRYLFAARDVDPGEVLEIVPVEKFPGVPDYYLLKIENVRSFSVTARSVQMPSPFGSLPGESNTSRSSVTVMASISKPAKSAGLGGWESRPLKYLTARPPQNLIVGGDDLHLVRRIDAYLDAR